MNNSPKFSGFLESRLTTWRFESGRLGIPESIDWALAGGPVNPNVRYFSHPPLQVRSKFLHAGERSAGYRVSFHVGDPTLVLALRPSSVGSACRRALNYSRISYRDVRGYLDEILRQEKEDRENNQVLLFADHRNLRDSAMYK